MTSPQQPPDTIEPVPEENQPGHHPPVEQDKPRRRPSLPPRHRRFGFRRDTLALASLPFGVLPDRAYVDVDEDRLSIRFGPWFMSTPTANIAGASLSGPYQWWKVIGPARLSLRDLGITFATSTDTGVCITFHEPIAGLLPTGAVRHRGVTVTVDAPDDLVRLVDQVSNHSPA
jgi:hypothetical protein